MQEASIITPIAARYDLYRSPGRISHTGKHDRITSCVRAHIFGVDKQTHITEELVAMINGFITSRCKLWARQRLGCNIGIGMILAFTSLALNRIEYTRDEEQQVNVEKTTTKVARIVVRKDRDRLAFRILLFVLASILGVLFAL